MSTSVSPSSSASDDLIPPLARSIRPPRNSSRLANRPEVQSKSTPSTTTSTLGPPIHFKIPSLPHHRTASSTSNGTDTTHSGRRPLRMVDEGNIPVSPREEGTSTPNRLKRLSLIARPSPLAESPSLAYRDEVDASQTRTTSIRMSEDESQTPRSMRMRSSISYSPASAPIRSNSNARSPLMSPRPSNIWDQSMEASRTSIDGSAKGETWSERHADLLQSIAQKQRRINELKQELQMEQSALYSLKQHFASLVSNTFSSPPPPTGHTTSLPIHRSTSNSTEPDWQVLSPTVSSHTSTGSSQMEEGDSNAPGFSSLLDEVLGNAPLVDPSVVEGGKRFIGNLMRTVGAAAGGTVPSGQNEGDKEGGQEGASGGGMDLSSLRGMFSSWSSSSASATPRPNTVRIRPADTASRSLSGASPNPPLDQTTPTHQADLI